MLTKQLLFVTNLMLAVYLFFMLLGVVKLFLEEESSRVQCR